MAGTPLALERSYGCLNCDYWDYWDFGDGQDGCAFAIWGCRSAVGTGLEDGRFVCCWVVQELGGGARTGAGRGSAGQEGGRVVRGDGLGAEGDEVGVVGGGEGVDGFGGGEGGDGQALFQNGRAFGGTFRCFDHAASRGQSVDIGFGEGGLQRGELGPKNGPQAKVYNGNSPSRGAVRWSTTHGGLRFGLPGGA